MKNPKNQTLMCTIKILFSTFENISQQIRELAKNYSINLEEANNI